MKNPKDLKIIFMGTPEFAAKILEHLVTQNFNIAAVVSQPDKPFGRGKKLRPTPVKKIAAENKIQLFQPGKMKEIYDDLEFIDPDIIITVAFGKILREKVISMPKYGCWNLHTSLLPKYRGAAPMQRAIENGEDETGISIFKIVKELDAGPIALKKKIKIEQNDNLEKVYDKLLEISKKSLEDFINNFENIKLTEQDHSKATYANKISKDEMKLNFEDAEKTHNKIRAFDPFPGTFALHKGKKVKLFGSKIYKTKVEGTSGKIVGLKNSDLLIETKNGVLKISKIQFPGKKPMTGKDAFNGNLISENDILN
ncbi:methionyl-tRNA formyltransferase [Geotoga petraea]|jgi:methionyl-tRNA formyltransferase|uniref:Methionyl-tRNA formyltransferase n=1 Tax=Geotoga petraea TaxID=28234 RepID=A0A4Z0W1H8_9BACT|nr:methionyl-tRNA formyltransferase [Geotoga petraea]MDK2945813.1 methionyl-tRNA formyltransferase [Geotoga sp.]TGG87614.1 methionyl-tRNA formyltransferase [Geotoga petraea]